MKYLKKFESLFKNIEGNILNENYYDFFGQVTIDNVDYGIIDYGLISLAGYKEKKDKIVIEKDTLFYYQKQIVGSKIPSIKDLKNLHRQKKLPFIDYTTVKNNDDFFKRSGFYRHLLKGQISAYWSSDVYSDSFYKTFVIWEDDFDINPNDSKKYEILHANVDCVDHGFLLIPIELYYANKYNI
jgi:hypothetical protein